MGVLVATAQGRVIQMNALAKQMLSGNQFFSLSEGKLHATPATYGRALNDAMANCSRGATDCVTGFSIVRGELPMITVSVVPIPPGDAATPNVLKARILILISDPEQKVRSNAELLKSLFDFTPAEALVALRLLDGQEISQIAKALRLSTHTVRNHLKRLFTKTNTNKQCELLHLLLRSPAGLWLGEIDNNNQ